MSKTRHVLKRFAGGFWNGILFVWNQPIIFSALLLVAAVFLFNVITKQAFTSYASCKGLIVDTLKVNPWGAGEIFCNAVGNTILDGVLERARKIVVWSIVLFFAFGSMFLTILINRFMSVIKILTLNKEEWRHFMATIRIWLLLFVIFGVLFYFNVMR